MAKAGSATGDREALGTKKEILTPIGALVGFCWVIWVNLLQPVRLAPSFLFHPTRLNRRIDALNIDSCGEAVKFFVFSIFILFVLGDRFNVAFLNLFKLDTAFDGFVFEIACALFLLIWANVQNAFLSLFCKNKRLFQGVLTINAGCFAFVLFLMCLANVVFDLATIFAPTIIAASGMAASELWRTINSIFFYGYLPFFIWFGYLGWVVDALGVTRMQVIASFIAAMICSALLVIFGMEFLKLALAYVKTYGSVV